MSNKTGRTIVKNNDRTNEDTSLKEKKMLCGGREKKAMRFLTGKDGEYEWIEKEEKKKLEEIWKDWKTLSISKKYALKNIIKWKKKIMLGSNDQMNKIQVTRQYFMSILLPAVQDLDCSFFCLCFVKKA